MDVVPGNSILPVAAATPPPFRNAAGGTRFATKLEQALAGVTSPSNQPVAAREADVAHAGVKADSDTKADADEPVVPDASAAQPPPVSATNPVVVTPVVLSPVLLDVAPVSASPITVAADSVPALDPGAADRAVEVAKVANIQISSTVDSPEKTSRANNSGEISDQRTNESGRFSDQPIQNESDLLSESAATTPLNGAGVELRAAEFEVTRATTLSTNSDAVSKDGSQFRGAQDGGVTPETVASLAADMAGIEVTSVFVDSTEARADAAPQHVVDDSAIDDSARKGSGDRPTTQAAGASSEKAPASVVSNIVPQPKSEFVGLPPVSPDTRVAERNRTIAAGDSTTDTAGQSTVPVVPAPAVTHNAPELKRTIAPPVAQPAVMPAETKAQPQTPTATQGTIQPNVKTEFPPAAHAKNESSLRTSNATDVQPNLRPDASPVVPPDAAVVAASVSSPATADVPAQPAAVVVTPAVHTNAPQPASSSDRGTLPSSPVQQDVTPSPVLPNSVTAAHLIARAASSEMQVGVRTEMFGGVVLHTSLRDGNLGVAIGSERGNLANVLAHDNAALQDALARNNVRLEDVRFFDLSGGASNFAGNSHAGTFTPQPHSSHWFTAGESVNEVAETDAQPVLSRPGLSVLA